MATTTVNKTQKFSVLQNPKGSMRVQEFFYMCISHWYWFVFSVVACMVIGYFYLQTSQQLYHKSAAILIKTDSQGRSVSSNAAMFEDLGVYNGNTYVHDEVMLLNSPDLMRDVVANLKLDITYLKEGKLRDELIYGRQLPVSVELPGMVDDNSCSFRLTLGRDGNYTVTEMVLNGKEIQRPPLAGRIGSPLSSPLGTIIVNPGKAFEGSEDFTMIVSRAPIAAVAAGLSGGLVAKDQEESFNIVDLSMTDVNPERAEDVLRELIACYNERWIADKRAIADNSSKFIDERVKHLQEELGSVDDDISSFKSANLMPDVDAAASIYVNQATSAVLAIKDLRNQEYMTKYIRNYLKNSDNNNKLLPSSTGLGSGSIAGEIAQYNTKILERNSLVAQSSATNPLVLQMDQALSAMRGALIATLDNELLAINEQIKSQEGLTGTAQSKIASNPRQAKYLLSVERQQKVKEQLYLYLLQKREENQLNQAFTSYNTRMIREAGGSDAPVAPVKDNVMLLAFVIGLMAPALILFIRECSIHVVRGRKDVKEMKIPFAGELPLHAKKQKLSIRPSLKPKEHKPLVAVKPNSRNSINEAFRVVRTNIEFMFGTDGNSKVVMITSLNPGSGKTFITYNLAMSLAIKGKRVVTVDLDMRKTTLSKYLDFKGKGISDYLANRVDDISSIIIPDPENENLSIIPVGTVPPNPTELLFSDRLHAIIEDLRRHYDYVFIDCPPVEVVADSSIISKQTDYTLFVIRAGLLDLSMLATIDEYYETGAYPNMSLILNGTVNPTNYYSRHYGNPYSYGYGYGNSYHYHEDE